MLPSYSKVNALWQRKRQGKRPIDQHEMEMKIKENNLSENVLHSKVSSFSEITDKLMNTRGENEQEGVVRLPLESMKK